MSSQIYHAELVFEDVLASALSGDGQRVRPKSLLDLDWEVICNHLSDQCIGADAAALAKELGLLPSRESVERRRAEITELSKIVEIEGSPPLSGIAPITTKVRHAVKGEILNGETLYLIAKTAFTADRVRSFFIGHQDGLPLLFEHVSRMYGTGVLYHEIFHAVDPKGVLLDSASNELRKLRRSVLQLQNSIRQKLDELVRSESLSGILQEGYVTQREGRYVLPVRAGERGNFPGIVHGHSSSGATLFIEPEILITINNNLRIAQMEVKREEHRILSSLSTLVADNAETLELNQDILTYIDLTQASVRFGRSLDGTMPTLVEDPQVDAWILKEARHPVLALRARTEAFEVIPNDIGLPENAKALIISGPNTGGKTVTLKTVGIFALLTRAGLPVPCDDNSTFAYFQHIFTDIGDEQTIEHDLSTFSGHVANIASFLSECGPTSLVLLDELFAGTDPQQGAALGRSLLAQLVDNGSTTFITTHLSGLKGLGFQDLRFAVASVGFNVEKLAPTFLLRPNVPGSSYAFRIAARLGLPKKLIYKAEALISKKAETESETVLQKMEIEYQKLRASRERAVIAADEAQQHERAIAKAKQKILNGTDKKFGGELKRMQREVTGLKTELKWLTKLARKAARSENIAEQLPIIEEVRAKTRKVGKKTQEMLNLRRKNTASGRIELDRSQLSPRLRVWIEPFQQTGEIISVPKSGKIPVQLGNIRATFAVEDIYEANQKTKQKQTKSKQITIEHGEEKNASETLDLRGERVEDALEQLRAHLEHAIVEEISTLLVIHGHGTGALKRAIRDFVKQQPSIASWRTGQRGEGGDGVTVLSIT